MDYHGTVLHHGVLTQFFRVNQRHARTAELHFIWRKNIRYSIINLLFQLKKCILRTDAQLFFFMIIYQYFQLELASSKKPHEHENSAFFLDRVVCEGLFFI